MRNVPHQALERVLEHLRSAMPDPLGDHPRRFADRLPPEDWPAFYRLLDLAADLPRLAPYDSLKDLPPAQWPALTELSGDLQRLQALVDDPVVPRAAEERQALADLGQAASTLAQDHCVTIDFFLDGVQKQQLPDLLRPLRDRRAGTWGALPREEAPELHALLGDALASERFRHLTGYSPEYGEHLVTLSLQDLEANGIGWHRDLYWPREWVGKDVFAVFYALGSDSPEKGGAFVYYVPWDNALYSVWRRQGDATLLWNSADPDGRLLHAVSGYRGQDTSRHLLILQCLRHQDTRLS